MNVLLIGGAGYVMDAIINKLNKEGHRIYILTGNKYKVGKYRMVYEKYHFPYDSDCIKEVFDSVNPDITIFAGAFDSNFNWNQVRNESVRFSSGLVNTLIAFSLLKHGRFIYLSSEEVYSESYPDDIVEGEMFTAISFRAMALAQGETVCRNYHQTMGLDVVVLRLDHLVDIPKNKSDVNEICSKMCMEALKSGKISVNEKNIISMVFMSDAMEFVYRILSMNTHKHTVYNIGSSEAVSEMHIAQLIQKVLGNSISIIDNTTGNDKKIVLSNLRFKEEFGLTILNHTEEIVQKVAVYMKRHVNSFVDLDDEGRGFFGKTVQKFKVIISALIPFAENMVCFIPFFMLNNRAVGSTYFANLDFYLLYVLIFAIVYGQQQATFSAIMAVLGYCFRQMYNRSGFEVMLDYNTYVWIAQLFILGLVVGYMSDRLKMIKGEGETEINYLSDQLYDIQDINTSSIRMKNVLETQIVNQNDSVGKIYEVISGLDKYEPEEVLFQAAEVLSHLMNSEDVAIYTVVNRSYARIISATSQKARELGNSIEYTTLGDMYEDLKQRRVFINKKLEDKYPLMANAIYSEDEMQIIFMVWGLPWERMTLSQSNMLIVIGYLIQNAVVRANRYMGALVNKRYMEGTNILEMSAFQSLMKAYLSASKKGLTICTIVRIDVLDKNFEKAGELLGAKLRNSDYLGKLEDGKLYALLSNTGRNDANFVINRFREAGYKSSIPEELNA
ncbi:MAG: NAD-dependent epimerase/dehydratase family protein [Velocimicrobium sp.]